VINVDIIYFNTIQYNIFLPIYCIAGVEYHNILYWCLRIVQYNKIFFVLIPAWSTMRLTILAIKFFLTTQMKSWLPSNEYLC
jgi:hypothetical protein